MKKKDKSFGFIRNHPRAFLMTICFLLLYSLLTVGLFTVRSHSAPAETSGAQKPLQTVSLSRSSSLSQSTVPSEKATPLATETVPLTEEAGSEAPSLSELSSPSDSFLTFGGFDTVTVYQSDSDTVIEEPLEDYITGTLLAEMPTSYHTEALRAQAVACRTYAVYKLLHPQSHPGDAELCTDAGHCQAYTDPTTVSEERYAIARAAVEATAGQILCYEGLPILAVFHASSGSRTCSSAEVWGGTLSYLSSVETYEEQNPTLDVSRVTEIDASYFASTLRQLCPTLSLFSDGEILNTLAVETSPSGRVSGLSACGESLSVSGFIKAFGLRSRCFSISHAQDEASVTVTTHGYGHGVGLSQMGAEDLAQRGYTYQEILTHYYTGVVFGQVE